MKSNKYIFLKINKNQYIKFAILCPEKKIHGLDPIKIFFYDHKMKYLLSENDYLTPKIEPMRWFFQAALEGKLELLTSIDGDLGYLFNKKLNQSVIGFENKIDDDIYNFLICDGNQYTTWLYTKNNSIFLQITPVYKWHFSDPEENEKFIPYDEFIRNYKSCITIEIKNEVVSKWVSQCDKIMELIIKNDDCIEPTN